MNSDQSGEMQGPCRNGDIDTPGIGELETPGMKLGDGATPGLLGDIHLPGIVLTGHGDTPGLRGDLDTPGCGDMESPGAVAFGTMGSPGFGETQFPGILRP